MIKVIKIKLKENVVVEVEKVVVNIKTTTIEEVFMVNIDFVKNDKKVIPIKEIEVDTEKNEEVKIVLDFYKEIIILRKIEISIKVS